MTSGGLDLVSLLLFVPGDRPDRFAKAVAAGADAVIVDLEDAVGKGSKTAAREAIRESANLFEEAPCPVLLRINAVATPEHGEDLRLAMAPCFAGIVLPKAEQADAIHALRAAIGEAKDVLALIETAAGLAQARAIAASATRLAFGSMDYSADLGSAPTRDALLSARSELVLASRLAGVPGPIDGVTLSYRDAGAVTDDAAHAASLGFRGKLLIHPAQIAPAAAGLAPSPEEVRWSQRILAQSAGGEVTSADGAMIDAPVRARALAIERRAAWLSRSRP